MRQRDKSIPRRAISRYHEHGFRSLCAVTYECYFSFIEPLFLDWILARYVSYTNPIEYHGIRMDIEHALVNDNIRARFPKKSYEVEERKLLQRHLPDDADVIELGGCMGFITAVIDDHVTDEYTVTTVEANPDLIEILTRTRELNDSRYDIIHAAYGPTGSEVEFYKHDLVVGGSAVRETGTRINVDAMSIEEIAENRTTGPFSLIADIEGSEVDLIKHELAFLEANCLFLCIEFHPSINEHTDDALEMLDGSSFVLVDENSEVRIYQNGAI